MFRVSTATVVNCFPCNFLAVGITRKSQHKSTVEFMLHSVEEVDLSLIATWQFLYGALQFLGLVQNPLAVYPMLQFPDPE